MKAIFILLFVLAVTGCSKQYYHEPPPHPDCIQLEDPMLNRVRPVATEKENKRARVVLLDTNGHYLQGTSWNFNGPVQLRGAHLSAAQLQAIIDSIRHDYAAHPNLVFTFDEQEYQSANPKKRMRCVLTIDKDWYTTAAIGGVAYMNSFTWGDDTPCFVFTAAHNYHTRNIGKAASHEIGHTLGCRHQSECSGATNIAEYRWYCIMGYPYTSHSVFTVGTNNYCAIQDDHDIIKKTLL